MAVFMGLCALRIRSCKRNGHHMVSQRKIDANRRNWAKRGRLTEAGRQRLREAAYRHRPWEHATGPKTAEGMRRARMNALRSGRYTAEQRVWRRDAMRFITLSRLLRDALAGRAAVADPAALIAELLQLARRLIARAPTSGLCREPRTPDDHQGGCVATS